jgi:hypothetical protein
MHMRGPVWCKPKEIGTPNQTYWRKKWKDTGIKHSGPSGYKARPARLLARVMAERARTQRGKMSAK